MWFGKKWVDNGGWFDPSRRRFLTWDWFQRKNTDPVKDQDPVSTWNWEDNISEQSNTPHSEWISRRDFIKWLLAAWLVAAICPTWLFAWEGTLDPNYDPYATPPVSDDDWEHGEPGENEGHWEHSEHERTRAALMRDAWAVLWFARSVLPNFLNNNPEVALQNGTLGAFAWWASSDKETANHFYNEMKWSALGVWEMILALQLAECIQFDYHSIMQEYIEKTQWRQTRGITRIKEVKEALDSMNIEVRDNKHPITVDKNHIIINTQKFSELLPLLLTNTDHFKNKIVSSIHQKTFRKNAENILNRNHTETPKVDEDVMKDLVSYEVEAIKSKIAFLTQFAFMTQLMTWVGQAAMIKREIKSIWMSVRSLFESLWFTQFDAKDYAAQIESKMTSSFFNKFSIISDVWPFMASLQLWWLEWVKRLAMWMLPVALSNIKWFSDEINEIFDEIPKRTWQKYDTSSTIVSMLEQNWSSVVSMVVEYFNVWFNDKTNQARLNWAMPSEIEKIDFSQEYDYKFTSVEKNINEIKKTVKWRNYSVKWLSSRAKRWFSNLMWRMSSFIKLDIFTKYEFDIDGKQRWLFEMLFYLNKVVSSKEFINWENWFDEVRKSRVFQEISDILNNPSFNFPRVLQALHFIKHDKWYSEIKNIIEFMNEYIDTTEYHEINNKADYENITKSYIENGNDTKDNNMLDMCVKEEIDTESIVWSLAWFVDGIRKNVWYLMYLEKENPELCHKFTPNFKRNFVAKFWVSAMRIKKELSKKMNEWELKFWNENIFGVIDEGNVDYSMYKIKIDSEEDKKKTVYEKLKWYPSEVLQIVEEFFEKTPWNKENIHHLIHKLEWVMWQNSFEVLFMVLMVQAPYIVPMVNLFSAFFDTLPKNTPIEVKKQIIWMITYLLSMFADNYVWEIVWHQLIRKNIPEMDLHDAIQFISPIAVVWWSQIITWNSPNAVIWTFKKFYWTAFNKPWIDLWFEKNKELSIIIDQFLRGQRDFEDRNQNEEYRKYDWVAEGLTFMFEACVEMFTTWVVAENPFSAAWFFAAGWKAYTPKVIRYINNISLSKAA